ncbi:MAG: MiaB/RimO family radical SAM methylthiotransferase [Vicinamibacterales bacterium]
MKFSVVTFGCRVNQADSLGFEDDLLRCGGTAAPVDEADLVIVNSCSVTCSADQGTRQTVRRVARANPDARIVVTGCHATREPAPIAALPNVIRVVPNGEKARFRAILAEIGCTTAERFGGGDGSCGLAIEPGTAGRTAFTLRAQTGCSEPCSFCIIPTTRGAPRSVDVSTILRDVERAVVAGFKEIALTGVHLGSYGRDLSPASSLLDLLQAFARVCPADMRLRISSLEPMECPGELVDLIAGDCRFAPHLHLPLQHASDTLLRAMRRPYALERYDRLVRYVRERIPDAAIGTDLIVGFPGETDEDFARLVAYLGSAPLTHAHVFPYSDRPGTPAASMPGKIDGRVVRERARILREVSAELGRRFRARQLGTTHRALTLDDGRTAVTGNYLKVGIGPGHRRNEWVRVRITSVGDPVAGVVQ